MLKPTETNNPNHKPATKWRVGVGGLMLMYNGAKLEIKWHSNIGGYLGYLNDELTFTRPVNGLSARASLAIKLQCMVDERIKANEPVKPRRFNMLWINRLVQELTLSKATHTFTFSRNEVMELMDMSGSKEVVGFIHNDGRLLRPSEVKPSELRYVKPLVVPTSFIIERASEGKLQ